MKYVLFLLAGVLSWLGVVQFQKSYHPAPAPAVASSTSVPLSAKALSAASAVSSELKATPAPLRSDTSPARATPNSDSRALANQSPSMPDTPAWQVQSPFTEPTKPVGPRPLLPQIVLEDVVGADNLYHDDVLGVAATFPEGWTVRTAARWGTNNSENTVAFTPGDATTARPSMYYQLYPNGYPALEGTEAYFRRVAQNKENQRIAGGADDYKNIPSTLEMTEINGNPAMSYFGVFGEGENVKTEFFMRILGKNGYVMFFVPGRMEDVKAILPQLKQMASTVKVP